ncbi:hypothetical protein FRC00_012633 [Tulasnella sp. 408]|nr:hypothetical protein FRC00_012633 [Tulasnella sp. 408]
MRATPGSDFLASERTTRSKVAKPKVATAKVKLKLGDKATQGIGTSFLGPYDRELDTEDEDDQDLVFEEQFILKMPEGEDCEKLRAMVQARAVTPDVWFKFKDSRRGVFNIGSNKYATKLVDLPCIIEAQKTLDGKQLFKVADICQALVVEERIDNEDEVSGGSSKTFNISDFIWPHGITPPLRHVRKRRFRKRISRAAIETVEQEMERLLDLDSQADQVEYKVLENVNPDLSDSEFDPDIRNKRGSSAGLDFFDGAGTPNFGGDAPTPGGADGLDMEEGDGEAENDEGSDDDLAAELERALAGEDEGDEDEEEEDEDEDETDEEEEEDGDAELTQAKKLLYEEIQDLEAVIEKKTAEIARIENPVLKSRLEASFNLKKLKADLESKRAMLEALTAKPIEEDALEAEPAEDDGDADDLFGDDEEDEVAEAVPAPPDAPPEPVTEAAAPAAGPVVIQLPSS